MSGIELALADITAAPVEAIVNAANEQLVLGGEVAGAIRRNGGPSIQAECNAVAPIATGQAVATGAGDLACRYVIHAVAPRAEMQQWQPLLADCVQNALQWAERLGVRSVALPALGTGVFGLPVPEAAKVTVTAARAALAQCEHVHTVMFCLFDEATHAAFEQALDAAENAT